MKLVEKATNSGMESVKPCIGSGLCCLKARCFLGVREHGPGAECPSLVWKDGRYWCGIVLKAALVSPEEQENLKRQLYVGDGCCMSLFNSLREERFKSMTKAQLEEYQLVKISLSRSYANSSEE